MLLVSGAALGPALADDAGEPDLVVAALGSMPQDAPARCAYTRVTIEGDESEVERFDPNHDGPPWTLLKVDGQDPREVDLRRYAANQEGRADRSHPMDNDMLDMVEPSSWRLRSDDGNLAEFEFRLRPHGELTERLVDKVIGSFVVDKRWQEPVRLLLESTEPASIAPFVRIEHYAQDLRFRYDDAVGSAVLAERRTERRGRAFGIKSLDRTKVFLFEDYACADDEGGAAGQKSRAASG